jgi:hypothetical protein
LLARFLRFFGSFFGGFTRKTRPVERPSSVGDSAGPDPMADVIAPSPIEDQERLSRFVFEADHYRPSKPVRDRLHFRAFLPSKKHPDDLSIGRTQTLDEDATWRYGDEVAGGAAGRQAIARGDLFAPDVRNCTHEAFPALQVKPSEPPLLHASIFSWPPLVETDARKSFAQQLRAKSGPVARSER